MGVLTIIAIIWFALQIILAGYGLMTAHGDPKRWKKIGLSLPMVFWEFYRSYRRWFSCSISQASRSFESFRP